MPTDVIDLVTVSREFGAGGHEFAEALGACLGWPVLDRQLVHREAERLELDDATVERLDEHPPSRLARLAAALLITPPEAPMTLNTSEILSPDAVAEAAHAAVVAAAQSSPLIVVGHGAQCIFRERAGTLHVRLVAPVDDRIVRICARTGWSASAAAEQAQRMDHDRSAYVMRYYHCDRRDPLLYDIQLNTGRISISEAAALVGALVRPAAPNADAVPFPAS